MHVMVTPQCRSTDPNTAKAYFMLALALRYGMMLSPPGYYDTAVGQNKAYILRQPDCEILSRSRSFTCTGISRSYIRLATCTGQSSCFTALTGSGGSAVSPHFFSTSFKSQNNRSSFRQPLGLALCQCIRYDRAALKTKPETLQTANRIH